MNRGYFSIINPKITPFEYDRADVKTGILHIGVGNFHRAHQESYTDFLLSDRTQHDWGICGVGILQSDENLAKALRSQDCLYTVKVCGHNGVNVTNEVGAMIEYIWGYQNPEKVFAKIADKNIKIITLSITEGSYNIDKLSNKFMLKEASVQHDLLNSSKPKTVFGFVAEGLRRRMVLGNGPISILSCDNLQHNGDVAKKSFTSFFEAQDTALESWVKIMSHSRTAWLIVSLQR